MNCLEFRRLCNTDLGHQDGDFLRHGRECPQCATLVMATKRFNRVLRGALNVEVPEELVPRVVLKQSFFQARRRRSYAMAASILLAIGIAGGLFMMPWGTPLDQVVVAHIKTESAYLQEKREISDDQLTRLFRAFGGELRGNIGKANYADTCKIRNKRGAHLVLAGRKGPVTVLLMPNESVSGRVPVHSSIFDGVIIPVGVGSMAIVGARGESLDEVEMRLTSAVQWRS